jgi:RNA polymerase sigma-70 factor (ECF subfamily)
MEARDEQIDLLVTTARAELPYIKVAFERLVPLIYPGVRHLATGITGSLAAADNVAQDVILRVMHGLPRLKQTISFPGWLRKITVNACNTWLSKEKSERKKLELFYSESNDSVDRSEAEDENKSFNEIVGDLNFDDRTIVSLKILNDLEFAEIAEVTGMSLSATKMRYYRALEKIKLRHSDQD